MSKYVSDFASENSDLVGRKAKHKASGIVGTISWDGLDYQEGLKIRLDKKIRYSEKKHGKLDSWKQMDRATRKMCLVGIGFTRLDEIELLDDDEG